MTRTLAWLALGLLASACGNGRVVGLVGEDAGIAADAAPPQRGPSDAALAPDVGASPADVAIDVSRSPDAPVPVDAPVDRVVVGVVDAAPDVMLGRACQVANPNACGAGSYCLSANCITGNCVVAPTSDQQAPVCGCDRITYWNAAVAATGGAGVRVDGACPVGVACGGIAGTNCPNGSVCNLEVANAAACNTVDVAGRCWTLPNICPPQPVGVGPTTRRCNGNACQSECDLLRNQRVFFVDDTCPQ